MPAHRKSKSPILELRIDKEQQDHAIQSNSGGCLIADAIKEQYPELSGVTVDMATIRVTDRKRGERYTYLTPPEAQHILLSFDQGWPLPTRELIIKRAVHIAPTRGVDDSPSRKQRLQESSDRLAELEARVAEGETLSTTEKQSLTRLRNYWANRDDRPSRPNSYGPLEVLKGKDGGGMVVRGGKPPVRGPDHPNLLRGRNRHFGAKLADPGEAFRNAVDVAVQQRLAES